MENILGSLVMPVIASDVELVWDFSKSFVLSFDTEANLNIINTKVLCISSNSGIKKNI